jgi:hypothetical protein
MKSFRSTRFILSRFSLENHRQEVNYNHGLLAAIAWQADAIQDTSRGKFARVSRVHPVISLQAEQASGHE